MNVTCAVLGPSGSFCAQAAVAYWGPAARMLLMNSIEEVFEAVAQGHCRHGMVPLQNSLGGSVGATLDQLAAGRHGIAGEYQMRVVQCLLAPAGVEAGDIEVVLSQAQALAQCRKFLRRALPGVRLEAVNSTARAAEMVSRWPGRAAAIAPVQAAELYRLRVLARGIQDREDSTTRFIHLVQRGRQHPRALRTTVTVALGQGGAAAARDIFARSGLPVTWVETRWYPPAGEYRHYLSVEASADVPEMRAALGELRLASTYYRCLGSYPVAGTGGVQPLRRGVAGSGKWEVR
ncbi:MAG: prephenate dehydratase domain-containing protein [Syntrophomonadaceae bacterium]|nr:hypothetical protein [Syntrophomonadaceae bacterium]MDH7498502.1 prephenate dehydratase domain-containing protein [Syntrophomonadaceae bacterium]